MIEPESDSGKPANDGPRENGKSGDGKPAIKYKFARCLSSFLHRLESLRATFPMFQKILETIRGSINDELSAFLKTHLIEKPGSRDDGAPAYVVKAERFPELTRLTQSQGRHDLACTLANRSFLIIGVSQFDVLVGDLIKGIFIHRPDLLYASDKKLANSELLRFETIKDVRDFCIEREIEDVLRKSHSDQFSWLESKLGIPLRKGLEVWPAFIEITERRNLCVHTDGVISTQYKKICAEHGVPDCDKVVVGGQVDVDTTYLRNTHEVLANLGTRLAYVVWRKIAESESAEADMMLNNTCVEMIAEGRFDLAIQLLRFPEELKRKTTREMHLLMQINLAQALKWKGLDKQAQSVLAAIEFEPLSDKFKLANHILSDEFDKAGEIMRRMDKTSEVDIVNYHQWPIFREFRKTEQFRSVYREVFGTEFEVDPKEIGKEDALAQSDSFKLPDDRQAGDSEFDRVTANG